MKKQDPQNDYYRGMKRTFNLTDEELQEWIDHKKDYRSSNKWKCKCGEVKECSPLVNFLVQHKKIECVCYNCGRVLNG